MGKISSGCSRSPTEWQDSHDANEDLGWPVYLWGSQCNCHEPDQAIIARHIQANGGHGRESGLDAKENKTSQSN